MSRRVAREEVFKILFESELSNTDLKDVLLSYLKREELENLREPQIKFIKEYITGIAENLEEINKVIDENMINWNIDRIGNVEKVLLRFGAFELLKKDTGKEIVVNEIIEIAKKYGNEKSHEFINGVLANIIKSIN
ncbi:NusB antitermination factor [Hypnocyclicus thermotrophus]|uniref:Transcription antitermination protein NusB n=1 Tax=Hypnocyclicus thermotrophus TaxID=1627895 RepID=A0AA46DX85_9FUSO|nr:transcription antitermination factor NusB [Hypnocyclicus thermotrophus]TDT67858.1 NusB antitermination factor [Hypnocyclicus thermotrophus]